jgi:enolase
MISDNLKDLDIPVPESVYSYDLSKQQEIYDYLISLNELQKKSYLIAKTHLGTSFNIFKSNGFKEWKNKFK